MFVFKNLLFSSEMLTKKSKRESLLDNFHKCLGLSTDPSEDLLLQELYSSLMTRTLENPEYYLALVKHKFVPFIKHNVNPSPLLACKIQGKYLTEQFLFLSMELLSCEDRPVTLPSL